jgi:hypothetical protein
LNLVVFYIKHSFGHGLFVHLEPLHSRQGLSRTIQNWL